MTYQNKSRNKNGKAMDEGNLSLFSDKAPVFRLFTQAVFVGCNPLPHAVWLAGSVTEQQCNGGT
jgi:hypothetical protein